MRYVALGCILLLAALAQAKPGRAEEPFIWGPAEGGKGDKPAAEPGVQEKVADLQGKLDAGDYDGAIEAASALVRMVKDEAAKTDALRILADATRKKGDWRRAATAYLRVRDRYARGSDEYLRYDAIAEILRSSPSGVYGKAREAEGAGARTLADDEALQKALDKVAEAQAERIRGRLGEIQRARSPQDVVAVFTQAAEAFRQARVLSPGLPLDAERQMAEAAGKQLAELMTRVGATLRVKQAEIERAVDEKKINSRQKKEAESLKASCEELSKNEGQFQAALLKVGGGGWEAKATLRQESEERRARYERFATAFIVPETDRYDWDWW